MLITELGLAVDMGRHFDALGVRWLMGGSVASSILGVPRATVDIDLVADLRGPHVTPLLNAIHQASMIRVDVFCATWTWRDRRRRRRRQR